jgi:hypothetical protein
MNRISRTLVAAALVVAPVALASPAQAQPWSGCTVEPVAPRVVDKHDDRVYYEVRVSCEPAGAERHVHVREEQRTWDTNQRTGYTTLDFYFPTAGGSQAQTIERPLPNTRPDNEVMYQRTRFKVNAAHVKGSYSDWESSRLTRIWH